MSNIRALPLSDVRADGSDVTFAIKLTGGGVFRGKLEGESMRGTFAGANGEAVFELTRKAEAKLESKSASAGKELEGRWRGAITVDGATREVERTCG